MSTTDVETFTLHVSPSGCDGWAGTLAAPLATLAGARDRLRQVRHAGRLQMPVEVLVHAGLYPMKETFTLGPEDLGTAQTPVTYRAFGDGEVRLIGGLTLRGFQPLTERDEMPSRGGHVVKLDLKAAGHKRLVFRQLFFNGRRQIAARYPNHDPENPYGGGFLYVPGEVREEHDATGGFKDHFLCDDPRVKAWPPSAEVELVVFPRWNYNNCILPVTGIDAQSGEVRLGKPASYEIVPGDRFYFTHVRQELDAPGEWYLDRENETLYFYPPDTLEGAVISVPVVQEVIRVHGDKDEQHGYITLRGFTIEGCDGDGVAVRDASHCAVLGCIVRNTGNTGVVLQGGFHNRADGCDVYETGNHGILAGGGHRSPFGGFYTPCNNIVNNCYVHHTGAFLKGSIGILLRNEVGEGGAPSCGVTASHNLIHDCPRTGIISNGNNNVVEYNHVRHVDTETADASGIGLGTRDWTVRGQIVRFNILHDLLGYHRVNGQWRAPAYVFGIYLDDWTSDVHVYGNLVYRAPRAGVYVHAGQDCVVENNILVDSPTELAYWSRWEEEREVRHVGTHNCGLRRNTFRRNICVQRRFQGHFYRFAGVFDKAGSLDLEGNAWDGNLLWAGAHTVRMSLPSQARNVAQAMPSMPLDEWRTLGYDTNSLVADPRFVDPDRDDYRLQPDSPAFKLGFEPLPLDKVGPYESEFRATWPIVEAEGVREHPHKII